MNYNVLNEKLDNIYYFFFIYRINESIEYNSPLSPRTYTL